MSVDIILRLFTNGIAICITICSSMENSFRTSSPFCLSFMFFGRYKFWSALSLTYRRWTESLLIITNFFLLFLLSWRCLLLVEKVRNTVLGNIAMLPAIVSEFRLVLRVCKWSAAVIPGAKIDWQTCSDEHISGFITVNTCTPSTAEPAPTSRPSGE